MTQNSPDNPIEDRFNSPGQAVARYVAQRGLLKAVVWRLVTVHIHGEENLDGLSGGFIVMANHSSHLDTPLIMGSLPARLSRYLAAGAAADYFFDVWWRRGLTALFFNAFPVDRSGRHPRAVTAKSLLQRGIPLLVFPEGTRSKDGKMGSFKPGGAALAASVNVPIVPVALVGAHEAHPRGTNWPKPGRLPVAVVFGQPLWSRPGEGAPQFMDRVKTEISRLRDLYTPRTIGQSNPAGSPEPKKGAPS